MGGSSPFTYTAGGGGGVWDVECHHFRLCLADLQAYLLSICAEARCLLLDVLVGVVDQSQFISKVQVFNC